MASAAEEIAELKKLLQNEASLRTATEEEVNNLKSQVVQWKRIEVVMHYFFFWSHLVSCFTILVTRLVIHDSAFGIIGSRKFWDIKTSQDAGRWGTPKRETWRRNCNTAKSVVSIKFWSWWGMQVVDYKYVCYGVNLYFWLLLMQYIG